jgi:hypothetical protein
MQLSGASGGLTPGRRGESEILKSETRRIENTSRHFETLQKQ